jgi:hypothetical protein
VATRADILAAVSRVYEMNEGEMVRSMEGKMGYAKRDARALAALAGEKLCVVGNGGSISDARTRDTR